jgi:hypothetical protein
VSDPTHASERVAVVRANEELPFYRETGVYFVLSEAAPDAETERIAFYRKLAIASPVPRSPDSRRPSAGGAD